MADERSRGRLLDRSLRLSEHETALEVGWLLAELEQRFGYSLDELARRFDRSVSWVSRRLALVEVRPEAIQQQVRGVAHDPQTHPGCAGVVFQNATAGKETRHHRRRRAIARSGDGGCHREPRAPAAGRRGSHGTGSTARRSGTPADRPHWKTTPAHRRKTSIGASPAC